MLFCSEIFMCYKVNHRFPFIYRLSTGYHPSIHVKSFIEGGIVSNLWLVMYRWTGDRFYTYRPSSKKHNTSIIRCVIHVIQSFNLIWSVFSCGSFVLSRNMVARMEVRARHLIGPIGSVIFGPQTTFVDLFAGPFGVDIFMSSKSNIFWFHEPNILPSSIYLWFISSI